MRVKVVYIYDGYYVPAGIVDAFKHLGHDTELIDHQQYFASNPNEVDLYYCQDSSNGIDFRLATPDHLRKTCVFYGDSRINYIVRERRFGMGDDKMARFLSNNGGWVFQSQSPDLVRQPDIRQSHLPFAADVYRWTAEPKEEKIHDLAFVGNCIDGGRAMAINYARKFNLFWPRPWEAMNEAASKIYRQSWVVFHAPTYYCLLHDTVGSRVDFDLTMRIYEALASGTPVITPPMADFDSLGFKDREFIFIYKYLNEMDGAFADAKEAAVSGGDDYAKCMRNWIVSNHSYEKRMQQAINVLQKNGVIQ